MEIEQFREKVPFINSNSEHNWVGSGIFKVGYYQDYPLPRLTFKIEMLRTFRNPAGRNYIPSQNKKVDANYINLHTFTIRDELARVNTLAFQGENPGSILRIDFFKI